MSDAVNLIKLLKSAPKDEKNTFIPDPKTDAFFEGLAKSKPLNPLELLDLADKWAKDLKSAPLASRLILQAIGDIGHDRGMLQILSKIADEQTTWGLSARDLLAKITSTYQGLSPKWIGTGAGPGGFIGDGDRITTYAYTATGSGCTYTPPTGPPITLAPKQKFVYGPEYLDLDNGEVEEVMITVTCMNFSPIAGQGLCLQIETVTMY